MNTSKKIMIALGLFIIAYFIAVCCTGKVDAPQQNQEIASNWDPFESIDTQLNTVDLVHDKWFKERLDVMASPAGKRVVCDWLMYKACAVTSCSQLNDAMDQFQADSMDYAIAEGVRSDYWASVVAWEEFVKAYNDENARKSLIDACKDHTPNLEKHFNNEIVAFQNFGKTEGLVDENGKLLPGTEKVALLLHRYVWIKASSIPFPRNAVMPPEEDFAVFRWQIEDSHLPIQKKLTKLAEWKNNLSTNYDFTYAEAALSYQGGSFGHACNLAKAGAASKDPKYTKLLNMIRQADPQACPN